MTSEQLKCCGVDGPQGWSTVFADGSVPGSCCVSNVQNDPNAVCRNSDDASQVFQDGCYEKLKIKTRENIVIIMGVGIGIAFVEVGLFTNIFGNDNKILVYFN